jgi:hypothetical protein
LLFDKAPTANTDLHNAYHSFFPTLFVILVIFVLTKFLSLANIRGNLISANPIKRGFSFFNNFSRLQSFIDSVLFATKFAFGDE